MKPPLEVGDRVCITPLNSRGTVVGVKGDLVSIRHDDGGSSETRFGPYLLKLPKTHRAIVALARAVESSANLADMCIRELDVRRREAEEANGMLEEAIDVIMEYRKLSEHDTFARCSISGDLLAKHEAKKKVEEMQELEKELVEDLGSESDGGAEPTIVSLLKESLRTDEQRRNGE